MRVSELEGPMLDLWVAKALDMDFVMHMGHPATVTEFNPEAPANEHNAREWKNYTWFQPSTEWADGGPIIEREQIAVMPRDLPDTWSAVMWREPKEALMWQGLAPTPLIAAMRCFVCSKLGDTVPDDPEK